MAAIRFFGLLCFLGLAGTAPAQWTATVLHPASAIESSAIAAYGSQQGGEISDGVIFYAGYWNSTAASWTSLHPAAAIGGSHVSGMWGTQQVGRIATSFGGAYHAGLWTGTPGSFVDLHPAGADESLAYGTDGTQQVGVFRNVVGEGACMWTGTAASFVELYPAGPGISAASAVHAGQQCGMANFHASTWRGTAASRVDLHPPGFTVSSAVGIHSGQQAGYVFQSPTGRASLWFGTAASWVDLSPAGAVNSSCSGGVHSGQQAGYVRFGSVPRASIWYGSANTRIDLHNFVPAEFSYTQALGIWSDGTTTRVVGTGYNAVTNRSEALLWTGPAPIKVNAATTTLGPGGVMGGTPANLNLSDDGYYALRPGSVLTTTQNPIVLVASYTLASSSAFAINCVVEARPLQGNTRQTIEAYNFGSNSYTLLNQQTLPTTSPDTVMTLPLSPSASYIGPGNEVRLRISYKVMGASLVFPWRVNMDEATLRVVY